MSSASNPSESLPPSYHEVGRNFAASSSENIKRNETDDMQEAKKPSFPDDTLHSNTIDSSHSPILIIDNHVFRSKFPQKIHCPYCGAKVITEVEEFRPFLMHLMGLITFGLAYHIMPRCLLIAKHSCPACKRNVGEYTSVCCFCF